MMTNINKTRISKHIAVMLAASLLCSNAVNYDASTAYAEMLGGACGDDATWTYENGTLTISGEGDMEDYITEFFDYGFAVGKRPWQDYLMEIDTVVIEDNITSVGSCALCFCENLTKVILPDSLQEIGYAAFDGCSSLTDITLPDSLQVIGGRAFERCSLTEITLPDSLQEIGDEAFWLCSSLTDITLPDSLQVIGGRAFYGCSSLTNITLPDSLQVLGNYAFWQCSSLTEITLPDSLQEIGDSAFYGCISLTEINLPDSLQEIGRSTFYGCSSLTEIALPDSMQSISDRLFQGCQNLTTVRLPDSLQKIGEKAFFGCDALLAPLRRDDGYTLLEGKYLVECTDSNRRRLIPEGTEIVANGLWKSTDSVFGNNDVIEVICPASLRTIGAEAFYDCRSLQNIQLNDGLERIGENALSKCSSLTSLIIPASVTEIGAQADCPLKEIYGTPGTAAEQFALENGIAFRDIAERGSQPDEGSDMSLDFSADIWAFGNSSEAFGDTYYLTEQDLAAVQAMSKNKFFENGWSGSCFGLALTVILAKNGQLLPAALQPGAHSLAEVEPTPQVQSLINYYHAVQHTGPYISASSPYAKANAAVRLYSAIQMAEAVPHGASPFLLEFATGVGGSHAMVGFGAEYGAWTFDGRTYDGRILFWDPNFPAGLREESCLYFDSLTYDYCIPHYSVQCVQSDTSGNQGGIIACCNDLEVLNAFPYSFSSGQTAGDVDGDGVCTIADAVLLARMLAEDETLEAPDFSQADVDADDCLTLLDLHALLRMLTA